MDSFHSPDWFRIAALRPALATHIDVARRPARGEVWVVLTDPASGRQHRLDARAWNIVGRCTGQHTVQAIWDALLAHAPDTAPTQGELVELITRLADDGLLQTGTPLDPAVRVERQVERATRSRWAARNPLAFRLLDVDPAAWLPRLDPFAQRLIQPRMFVLWCLLVGAALLGALANGSTLAAEAGRLLAEPRFLLLIWLVYPFIKTVHELAHALALRRWHAPVPRVGLTLLALVPAPFVDASAASVLPRRHQRAVVSAAGIQAELALAACALFIWLALEPGLVRDAVFAVVFVGGVSTVLFNGNPLLRFDGYYLLTDLADLPNLATRSQAHWLAALQRLALGRAAPDTAPAAARGEALWLWLYAPLSWAYKLAAGIWLSTWLASMAFALGALAALGFAWFLLLRPAWRALQFSMASPMLGAQAWRARGLAAGTLVTSFVLLGALPLPATTVAEGVVWLPERAQLRTGADGFITRVVARDGEWVQAGQLIAVLDDPAQEAQRNALQAELARLQASQFSHLIDDPLAASQASEAIAQTQAALDRQNERQALREIRAGVAGRLVMPRQADLPGRYLKQGTLLGHVFRPDDVRVRTAVPERDIAAVRAADHARILLADLPERVFDSRPAGETPAATTRLPSAALGDRAGGTIATDPTDRDGLTPLSPVFLVDLSLPQTATPRVGGRAWVAFDGTPETLAARFGRRAQQLFLKHFAPAA
jgi:putative peptide zinc metalloprotease protein